MTPNKEVLRTVYGKNKVCQSRMRFEHLSQKYQEAFQSTKMEFFSAPGRTEIVGNHTDHNGGKVLAASINMDTIGAAYPNDTNIIQIISEGYANKIIVNLETIEEITIDEGTRSLVAGIAKAVKEFGYNISGFNAYISTEVISSAGVSSSASFEMLLCSIIDFFFNNCHLDPVIYAKIGQYAENKYWSKASGLMDQMACAVGGTIILDFHEDIKYKKIEFDYSNIGYQLVIINTGKSHADLSQEYSEIPQEMRDVANSLGVDRLCDTSIQTLKERLNDINKIINNDRAILRAIHFFEENDRVDEITEAIHEQNNEKIKQIISESGRSSRELLQNCFSISDYKEQKINLYLTLTEMFLKKISDGCCRVHGGGFAGVIMCALPKRFVDEYIQFISAYAGKRNVYLLDIRQVGAIHLEK